MLSYKSPCRFKCIKEVPTNFAKKRSKSKFPQSCGTKVLKCGIISPKRMQVKIACKPNIIAQFLIILILFLQVNHSSKEPFIGGRVQLQRMVNAIKFSFNLNCVFISTTFSASVSVLASDYTSVAGGFASAVYASISNIDYSISATLTSKCLARYLF